MKNILPALLLMLLMSSCTKESVNTPASQTIATSTAINYEDNSISVVDFKAQAADNNIQVTFTTLYEKSVVKLEILKGLTANNLCSIYKQSISADSDSATVYSTADANNAKASNIYYMVKYTLANGDWGYTPVFKLSL